MPGLARHAPHTSRIGRIRRFRASGFPPNESFRETVAWATLAWATAILVWLVATTYNPPAHPGVDQNGYLVAGKQLARTLSPTVVPERLGIEADRDAFDVHGFVGRMWVGVDLDAYGGGGAGGDPARAPGQPRYVPKYPLGLPALYATLYAVANAVGAHPVRLAFAWSPLATALATAGTFWVARRLLSGLTPRPSFWSWIAAVLFAASPTTLLLATNPNSHATAVAAAVWGVWALLAWRVSTHRPMLGVIGGLLLGFAATVRYPEATLLLVALVLLPGMTQWRKTPLTLGMALTAGCAGLAGSAWFATGWPTLTPQGGGRTAAILAVMFGMGAVLTASRPIGVVLAPLLAWATPVGLLLAYNLVSLGRLTGYASTHEQSAFSPAYFADNWGTLLRTLDARVVPITLGLSVSGLLLLTFARPRSRPGSRFSSRPSSTLSTPAVPRAAVLAVWVIPLTFIYTTYYWAPTEGIGYARFFLTLTPALTIAATAAGVIVASVSSNRAYDAAVRVTGGVVTVLAAATGLAAALPELERDAHRRAATAYTVDGVLAVAPSGSVVFSPSDDLLNVLQFSGDYTLYPTNLFDPDWVRRMTDANDWRSRDLPAAGDGDPRPDDPGRRALFARHLASLDADALAGRARRRIEASRGDGRRVFFVVSLSNDERRAWTRWRAAGGDTGDVPLPAVVRRLTNRAGRTRIVATWPTPHVRPPELTPPVVRSRPPALTPGRDGLARVWQLIEVVP